MNKIIKTVTLSISILIIFCSNNLLATQDFSAQAPVQQFINRMVEQHHFDRQQLTLLFNTLDINKQVIKSTKHPAEAKPWCYYKQILVDDKSRRDAGLLFWQKNNKTLLQAQKKYGVPAEIIVAILGIETKYGQNMGKYPVLTALSTLAFAYPQRASFFEKELEQYLLLARENQFQIESLKGSYAGAMGQPQFMPSSYRHYAVSYKGNESIDLFSNDNDVIFSIANYLKKNGWKQGDSIVIPASISGKEANSLLPKNKKFRPNHSILEFEQAGVKPSQSVDPTIQATLLKLKSNNGYEYWLGMNNFYVITRYNNSINYAMAVFQLSNAIKQTHDTAKA